MFSVAVAAGIEAATGSEALAVSALATWLVDGAGAGGGAAAGCGAGAGGGGVVAAL